MPGQYEKIASFLPRKWAQSIRKELDYLGIDINERKFLGFLFVFGLLLSAGVSINLLFFLEVPWYISFPVLFAGFLAGAYLWLGMASESKGKFVEKILPDALQLIASNLKAGMTTERALLASARPEFGPLSEELQEASKRVLTGDEVENALDNIATKIKSRVLERTLWLVNKGINSGGQMSDLLVTLSNDLREQNVLQAEIRSNVSIYVILILFSSVVGAPVMLGISSFIVQILAIQSSKVTLSPTAISTLGSRSSMVGIPQSMIDPSFVVWFALLMVMVTVAFAAMAVGVIQGGKEKNGLRYAPFMIPAALLVFFAIRWILLGSFGHLLA